MLASYGITPKPTTVKNPRANTVVERMHLTAGDMLRTMTFEGENWELILHKTLQSVSWAIRSTLHSTIGHSPGQLVFSHDMIMQNKVFIDWEKIRSAKDKASLLANIRENKSRVAHHYARGDQVLIVYSPSDRKQKMLPPTEGPYPVTKVYQNGTVRIQRAGYKETIHIRRLRPYNSKDDLAHDVQDHGGE